MDKSCDLKGQQKLFFLNQNRAASCCKAYGESLTKFATIDQLVQHWQQEQQAMASGHEVSSCSVCWQNETQGHMSYRLLSQNQSQNFIELFIDNACNQMCSYCSPKFSSVWQQNIALHGNFRSVSKTAQQNLNPTVISTNTEHWIDQIHQYIRSQPANSITIKLAGGEPLMQFRQLQTLIDFNSDRIAQLRLNTNLNPPTNKFLDWLLQRVPPAKLFFDISLDATPEFNHVPRAGFDKEKFTANLALIRQRGIDYRLLSVISVLSVFDLNNFVTWTTDQRHPVSVLPLNNPDCLDARLIPDQFKAGIDTTNLPRLAQDVLKLGTPVIDIKLHEQYNYLTQYFDRTNTDPDATDNEHWQQYWQWLKERFA